MGISAFSAPSMLALISFLVPLPSSSQQEHHFPEPEALREADLPPTLISGMLTPPPSSQHSGTNPSQPHFSSCLILRGAA